MQLPRPGDILEGKYQLEEMLGEGAYGLVVKATTLTTNRPVAVKIMKPSKKGYTDRRAQRFMRELRVIAKLQCPNTLTLYDFGKTDAGILFMVTEYVEGEDLYELLERRGTLTEKEALHVLHQSALSLSEAHEHGVLHRDIKPHNIRLTTYGDDPLMVKVLDFGLSKTLEDDDSSTLTAAGVAVGTPRYMSPEQLAGKELTPASDIYSLGLVVFEMVLERPPTPLDSTVGNRRNVQIPPDAPFSRPFKALVNRMLQRPLPERYKSASEVLAGVKAVRAGEMPVAPDTSSPFRSHTGGFDAVRATGPQRAVTTLPTAPSPSPARYVAALALVLLFVGTLLWFLFIREDPDLVRQPRHTQPVSVVNNWQDEIASPHEELVVPDEPEVIVDVVDLGPPTAFVDGKCSGLEPYKPGVERLTKLDLFTQHEALVLIPPGYDPTRPIGLVWAFHDYNGDAAGFLTSVQSQLEDVAGEEQYVVLAPTAFHQKVWEKEGELEAAWRGLEIAREQLCIDPDKVFAWGHGFGGRAAARQAMCMPEIAAVATSSYRVREMEKLCQPQQGEVKPYLHIAATRDNAAPIEGGRGCIYGMPSMSEHLDYFRRRNGCGGEPRPVKVKGADCEAWRCRVPFQHCLVNGGRTLPNAPVTRLEALCNPESSTFPYVRTVWQFFGENARGEP